MQDGNIIFIHRSCRNYPHHCLKYPEPHNWPLLQDMCHSLKLISKETELTWCQKFGAEGKNLDVMYLCSTGVVVVIIVDKQMELQRCDYIAIAAVFRFREPSGST